MKLFTIWENRKKVLGLNERGLKYIRKYNNSKAMKIADDKILTKKILNKANIPTPKLITIIRTLKELDNFDWSILPASFVIKPVRGLEGGGIDIFYNRDESGRWIRADKSRVTLDQLKQQIKEILEGRFSLNQTPDRALIEERVRIHKAFKYYTYKGTPDVRVIVFNKVPIMSFIRLPTRESGGKANLALGAIGAGIDMASGITTSAIQGKSGYIEYIPGTKIKVSGLKIPFWNKILNYSIEAEIATNINFVAVDFLIDRDLGPMIVELNSRPGLSIQLANRDGLRWRLKKAIGLKVGNVEKGINLAKYLFGGQIEQEIETISGKEIIGIYENIKLYDSEMNEYSCKAKIDTGADSTSLDRDLAVKLGYGKIIEEFEKMQESSGNLTRQNGDILAHGIADKLVLQFEKLADVRFVVSSNGMSIRPYIKINVKIQNTLIETIASVISRKSLNYPVIIGRNSMQKFLVDPSKTAVKK